MASRQQTLKLGAVAIAAAVLTQVLSPAGAAPITWSSPTTISGSGSQVLNTNTLVAAVRFGSTTDVTVNGVTFASGTLATTTRTIGNLDFISSASINPQTNATPSVSIVTGTAYSSLVASMQRGNASYTFTIKGLTSGLQYVIQYWASQSIDGAGNQEKFAGRTVNLTAASSGTASLDVNVGDTAGNTGQFVTGTFTADAATQQFVATGGTWASPGSAARVYVNAVQVRVVPEPSTLALASLGIVGVGSWFCRRRIRRAAEESSAADASTTA